MSIKNQTDDLVINRTEEGFYKGFNQVVTIGSKLLISALVLWDIIWPEEAGAVLSSIQGVALGSFGAWYIYAMAAFFVVCIVLAFAPKVGNIKLGGADTQPEFSRFSWFSMMFGAGIGIGMLTYATGEPIGLSEQLILDAMTLASFIEFLVTLPIAWLGDKWGRKNIMYIGLITSVLTFAPFLLAMPGRIEPLVFLLASLVRVAMSATYAPIAAILAQMFRPQARYTSISLSYGCGAALWAGFSPWFATQLIAWTGSVWSVIAMFTAMAAIAFVCTWRAPQHSDAAPVTESFTPRTDTTANQLP